MAPHFAVALMEENPQLRSQLAREPKVRKRDGSTMYNAGYDLKNTFMMEVSYHKTWDGFAWSIYQDYSGTLRAFIFNSSVGITPNTPIRRPGPIDYPEKPNYWQELFPPAIFFLEHFKEAVKCNFRAAAEFQAFSYEPPSEGGAMDKLIERVGGSEDTSFDWGYLPV
ncbi:hypothetical protein BC832DRAFT_547217 [Gaertneriomyces semiglobifer]|nr:hypothetical protein BC832DRAFT_547217 [Gaertneriomyces semiglobifer]